MTKNKRKCSHKLLQQAQFEWVCLVKMITTEHIRHTGFELPLGRMNTDSVQSGLKALSISFKSFPHKEEDTKYQNKSLVQNL